MSETICLDKHEMVIDKDKYCSIIIDLSNLSKFANWCISNEFDSGNIGIMAKDVLGKIRTRL